MSRQKTGDPMELLFLVLGTFPVDQALRIGKQVSNLQPDHVRVRGIVAGKDQTGCLAGLHKVAVDTENELTTPHVATKGRDGSSVEFVVE